MAESVGKVMLTNGLLRDGLLLRSSAPQRLLQFLSFSDSSTVIVDDLLLIRVNGKSSGFVVRRRHLPLFAKTNRDFGFGSK